MLDQLTGENKSLKEANSKIKEEYGEISKSYKVIFELFNFQKIENGGGLLIRNQKII